MINVFVILSILLASFIFNLDNGTSITLSTTAASSFGRAQSLNAVTAITAILLATGKPFFGKLSQVIGRSSSLMLCLVLLSSGYTVCSLSRSITMLGIGMSIWQIGFSGFHITLQVVIADATTLRYRSFFSVLTNSGWFAVLFYFNGKISHYFTHTLSWRGGFGVYAFCYIPALLPLIVTLSLQQRRAKLRKKKSTSSSTNLLPKHKAPQSQRLIRFMSDVDIVGLYLLLSCLVYIFLPIILANQVEYVRWDGATIPAMLAAGVGIIIPAFIYWETKCATHPVLPLRFLRNRTIAVVCIINFFDFASFYMAFSQLLYFVQVATDWDTRDINYFIYTQALSMTFCAIAWSIVAFVYQIRWRSSVTAALVVRLLGITLMLYARNHPSTLMLALTQVLQGAGGGIVAVATQVGAQGAVHGSDLAMATASVLLFAEMGNVTGQSIASAINVQYLPKMITSLFPQLSIEDVARFVGDPSKARHLGVVGTIERQKMIEAFSENMKLLTIPAALLSLIPIVASRFMDDFNLDQRRNVIETPEQLVSKHGATMTQKSGSGSGSGSDSDSENAYSGLSDSDDDVESGGGRLPYRHHRQSRQSRTHDRHFNNALNTYRSVDTLRSHTNAAVASSSRGVYDDHYNESDERYNDDDDNDNDNDDKYNNPNNPYR